MNAKRILATAALVAAVAAPTAQARPASDGSLQPTAAPAEALATDYAEMAARREAVAQRHYDLAEQAPQVRLVETDTGGFPWALALAGAFVPALLLAGGRIARPAMRRRRFRLAG